jgi:FtsP/CotA-like multicopper oxidase with cupredoxin domain
VRNTLFNSVVVYGLSARGAGTSRGEDTVQIRPGAVQEISFPAGAPGTYYYSAKSARDTSSADPLAHAPVDAVLGGAFVIDAPGAALLDRDRVFVLNFWDPLARPVDSSATAGGEPTYWFTVNGKAWPSTERFSSASGDTVRMRFVNMAVGSSSMLLELPTAPNVVAATGQQLESGATCGLELTPRASGELTILLKSANGTLLARLTVQIRFRGSGA